MFSGLIMDDGDSDSRYSDVLLHGAEKLYQLIMQQPGRYRGSSEKPAALLYNSSGCQDELLWGGA